MRPRMSDGKARRFQGGLAQLDKEWLSRTACAEARSILAETEPVDYAWYRMRAHHATGWGSLEALAESLRSFVEGN